MRETERDWQRLAVNPRQSSDSQNISRSDANLTGRAHIPRSLAPLGLAQNSYFLVPVVQLAGARTSSLPPAQSPRLDSHRCRSASPASDLFIFCVNPTWPPQTHSHRLITPLAGHLDRARAHARICPDLSRDRSKSHVFVHRYGIWLLSDRPKS